MYRLILFIVYFITGVVSSFLKFSTDETQAMWQITGMALCVNYFATIYIRDFLMYLLEEDRDDDFSIIDTLFNVVYTAISSFGLYLFLSFKKLGSDLPIMLTIVYFIMSFVIIYYCNKQNHKSMLYNYANQCRNIKYFLIPIVASLIWLVPVIVVELIFIGKLTSGELGDDTIALLICPNIYTFLVAYVYSKINSRFLANDCDRYGYSPSGIIYSELFMKIFFIFVLFGMLFVRSNFNADAASSYNLLATTFIIVFMVFYFIRLLCFDGFVDSGGGSSAIPKNKRIRATTFNYGPFSTTEYVDEEGNKTKVDHWKF